MFENKNVKAVRVLKSEFQVYVISVNIFSNERRREQWNSDDWRKVNFVLSVWHRKNWSRRNYNGFCPLPETRANGQRGSCLSLRNKKKRRAREDRGASLRDVNMKLRNRPIERLASPEKRREKEGDYAKFICMIKLMAAHATILCNDASTREILRNILPA